MDYKGHLEEDEATESEIILWYMYIYCRHGCDAAMWCGGFLCDSVPCDGVRCDGVPCDSVPCDGVPCDGVPCDGVLHCCRTECMFPSTKSQQCTTLGWCCSGMR